MFRYFLLSIFTLLLLLLKSCCQCLKDIINPVNKKY